MLKDYFAAIGFGVTCGALIILVPYELYKSVEFFKEKWKSLKDRKSKNTR